MRTRENSFKLNAGLRMFAVASDPAWLQSTVGMGPAYLWRHRSWRNRREKFADDCVVI